ncbi:MAG: CPBP family intramembrane metalloprotease [Planctomycetes bacterium]|nr:CPBP family intramembrane metalloprotease [Planctomycetota bacterium]
MPIIRRFILLAALSFAGALLFLPFLSASASGAISTSELAGFMVIATSLSLPACWLGLRWSDRAQLPMPLLRAWEMRSPIRPTALGILRAVGVGAAFGFGALAVLRIVQISEVNASLPAKVGSALFAAVTLEVVVHLALMSGVVVLSGGRVWLGIAISALAFVAFHLSTVADQPMSIVLTSVIANGTGGILFGWLYARDGFEYLVLAHGLAHVIAVGLA